MIEHANSLHTISRCNASRTNQHDWACKLTQTTRHQRELTFSFCACLPFYNLYSAIKRAFKSEFRSLRNFLLFSFQVVFIPDRVSARRPFKLQLHHKNEARFCNLDCAARDSGTLRYTCLTFTRQPAT